MNAFHFETLKNRVNKKEQLLIFGYFDFDLI